MSAKDGLAEVPKKKGKLDEAEVILRQSLETRQRVLGEENPWTLNAMDGVASVLKEKGNLDEAETIYRHVVDVLERTRDKGDFGTLWAMMKVAEVLEEKGELDQAEEVMRKRVEIARDARVVDWEMLETLDELACFLDRRGKVQEAETVLRECLSIQERFRGEKQANTLQTMNKLANVLWRTGRLDELEALNRRNLEIRRRIQGEQHAETLWAMANLADVLEERGKIEAAIALRRKSLGNGTRLAAVDSPIGESATKSILPGVLFREEAAANVKLRGDALAATPSGGGVLARDDFEGGLTLNWQILNPDPTHFSLSGNPGTLTITTQNYANLFLMAPPMTATNDVQLTTCIASFEPFSRYHQAGLILRNGDDDYLKFVYEWTDIPGGRALTVGVAHRAQPTHVHFIAPRELSRIWLRITKRGNRYAFSTSLDGTDFVPAVYPEVDGTGLFQRGAVWGDGCPKYIGLFAITGSEEASEIDASFDFFEVRATRSEEERTEKGTIAQPRGGP